MARISINEASKSFAVSRTTIYARIKAGQLSKDSEGKVDSADIARIFGSPSVKFTVQESKVEHVQLNSNEQLLKQENQQLKQQIQLLQQQLDYSKTNEQWLKQQIEQLQPKRIEHKSERKGFIAKLFG